MTIDEAKERAAFEAWFASTYPTEDANDIWHGDVGPDMFIGWKAGRAQPVTVTREAFYRALMDKGVTVAFDPANTALAVLRALGIEVK